MFTVALTGSDVIKINGRILNDSINGDVAVLTYPNDLSVVTTGKNGNSVVAFKCDGRVAELSLRLVRGSADDKFLNNLLSLYDNDPAAFSLMTGEFSKQIGDGAGNVIADTYILSGGVFKKKPEAKENADGDTEQAVTVHSLVFTNAPRVIG